MGVAHWDEVEFHRAGRCSATGTRRVHEVQPLDCVIHRLRIEALDYGDGEPLEED